MQSADAIVILGNCQFEKGGFQNRFRHKGYWNTFQTSRNGKNINQKIYISPLYDWKIICKRLSIPKRLQDDIAALLGPSLIDTNINIIKYIANRLKIKTKILQDYPTNLSGTERLVDLCQKYGASEYLSGPSGNTYLDKFMFSDIKLSFFKSSSADHVLTKLK